MPGHDKMNTVANIRGAAHEKFGPQKYPENTMMTVIHVCLFVCMFLCVSVTM